MRSPSDTGNRLSKTKNNECSLKISTPSNQQGGTVCSTPSDSLIKRTNQASLTALCILKLQSHSDNWDAPPTSAGAFPSPLPPPVGSRRKLNEQVRSFQQAFDLWKMITKEAHVRKLVPGKCICKTRPGSVFYFSLELTYGTEASQGCLC